MKSLRILLAIAFGLMATLSMAQTAQQPSTKSTTSQQTAKQQGISDDDLRKYAITMDSVKVMQETLKQILTENVQKNTVMEVPRYNQLLKIATDQAALTAANATAEEIAFLKDIDSLRLYNMDRINKAYQALAKDYVGLKAFNAIRKSLDADADLKARYDAIAQEVQGGGDQASNKIQGQ